MMGLQGGETISTTNLAILTQTRSVRDRQTT